MFDMFGMNKANTREAIEYMAKGVTLGLLEGYEYRLQDKQMEIDRLKKEIEELKEKLDDTTIEEVQNGGRKNSRGTGQKRGQ